MPQPIAYGADWSEAQLYGPALTKPVNDQPDRTGRWYRLSFTLRYADFPGQGHAVLTEDEYESHLAAGLRSMLIYQRTTRDPDGGEARGREFGRAAVAYAQKIGYRKGEPIFATADDPAGTFNLDIAEAYFRGFAAEVRAADYRAGGYGFWDVIYRLQDRGVVDVLWLCGAESRWRPGIHIYQWNNGRIYPAGITDADLVKQFEPIPGGGAVEELMSMNNPLVRDPATGACYLIEISPRVQSRWYIPNTEILGVFAELLGVEGARDVSSFAANYLANEQGPPPIPVDVDEAAIVAGVTGGVVPAVVAAMQSLNLEGLDFPQTVEAVREALRQGTGQGTTVQPPSTS